MKKKTVIVVLILVILFTTSGLTYSGWGPIVSDFGSIVVSTPGAHPWGDNPHSTNTTSAYHPSSGSGYPKLSAPTFTDFVIQFYLKYVVKKAIQGQSSVQKYKKGE